MVAHPRPQPKSAAKSAAPAIALESFTATGNVLATGKGRRHRRRVTSSRVEQSNGRQDHALPRRPPWPSSAAAMAPFAAARSTLILKPTSPGLSATACSIPSARRRTRQNPQPRPRRVGKIRQNRRRPKPAFSIADGGVYADTTDATGAKSSARGDHVVVDLIPAPKPAAHPLNTPRASIASISCAINRSS